MNSLNTIDLVAWEIELPQRKLVLHVRAVELQEGVSAPYRARVECIQVSGEDLGAAANEQEFELLGENVFLTRTRGNLRQGFSGIIVGFTTLGVTPGHHKDGSCPVVQLEIGPAMVQLQHRQHSRVFQGQSLVDIATQVLQEGLDPFAREVECSLAGSFPRREMVVQYEESDLAFVERLLDEAGVDYFFKYPPGEPEKLVLVDALGNDGEVATLAGSGKLVVAGEDAVRNLVEGVFTLKLARQAVPERIEVRGRDWTRPDYTITGEAGKQSGHHTRYLHDGRVSPGQYGDGSTYSSDEASTRASIEFAQSTASGIVLVGESNAIGLVPGQRIEVLGHQYDGLDATYIVTQVEHTAQCPGEELDVEGGAADYTNRFKCVPLGAHWSRPHRSRPVIMSIQTATVVGPEGEEIHTDEHGRVQVRFHWDQAAGLPNNQYSAWIRVAQAWSGAGFGAVFVPRVGTEVVVSFINGDPDRPLVTGCVYHTASPMPVDMPAKKSQSVIRTRSTPGSRGYNELRFEDAAGAEKISMHAQRNLCEVVGNEHETRVRGEQRNFVEKAQKVVVGASQSIQVEGHRQLTVGAGEEVMIKGGRVSEVEQTDFLHVAGARRTVVTEGEQHFVGGIFNQVVDGPRHDEVTGIYNMQVNEEGVLNCKGGWETVSPKIVQLACRERDGEGPTLSLQPKHAALTVGQSGTTIQHSGVVEVVASKRLSLVCGSARIDMSEDGTIELSESKSGTSRILLRPGTVQTQSLNLKSEAMNTNSIQGTVVRIN